ncbi:MAG: P-II family nitrogen regulator [Deltaproteobacteria bacterium]|nr:P-II family nitrogen regulator [Deltaproteobacteria bacterium]
MRQKSRRGDEPLPRLLHEEGIEEWTHCFQIMLKDELVDKVVETITKTAHTGNPGDGKVFVYDIEKAVRIKTFEHGEEAI